jgi:hypothetical protein
LTREYPKHIRFSWRLAVPSLKDVFNCWLDMTLKNTGNRRDHVVVFIALSHVNN